VVHGWTVVSYVLRTWVTLVIGSDVILLVMRVLRILILLLWPLSSKIHWFCELGFLLLMILLWPHHTI